MNGWNQVAEDAAAHGENSGPSPPASAESRPDLRPYAYVLAGVMLGGLSPVFTKLLLLQNVTGPTIVAARYLLTVLFLLPFGIPRGRREGPPPGLRAWVTLFLVGAFGSGVGALMFTYAVDLASAGVVNAISKTAPIFVALFSYFTLRERVTYLRLLLVGVMVAADVLIAAGELTFSGALVSARLLGDALALGAGIMRAAAEVLGKSALRQFRPSTVALWRFAVGLLVAGAVASATGGFSSLAGLSTRGWLILLALGGLSTALYMALYYRGLAELPAHVAVSLRLLGAVVTVIVSWIVLGERLTPYHVAGIAVLISGAYLLVMRTAQPRPEIAPPLMIPTRRPWTRLRPRLVGLVTVLVIASVGAVWYLSVRDSAQLLNDQAELTVGEIAAILVEFGGLEERPSWQAYQQYLQRIVGHRVKGHLYALEVVYLAALDPRGNIGAYAASPDLQVMGEDGRTYRVRDRESMRQLLDAMELPGGHRGIITATAQLVSEGNVVGVLKLGCRSEMSKGMVGEIVGRSAVAALTVLLLAAAITTLVVGGMVEPIERLAAELNMGARATGRGAADTDEVEQIRRALGIVSQAIGVERRTIAALSVGLAGGAAEQPLRPPPLGRVWLRITLGEEPDVAVLAAAIEAAAREAARQEGVLSEVSLREITAQWRGERDDPLRAVLAAVAIREELSAAMPAPVTIAVGAGEDAAGWPQAQSAASAPGPGEPAAVLIGREALARSSEHIESGLLADAGGFSVLVGLSEPGPIVAVAEEPDE